MFDEVGAPAASNLDEEADVFGREALIPSGLWGSCRSQYDWTRQAILDDARRLGVGPSVVVGHIRRLCGDVDLPGRLSANLDVRKQLVEAALAGTGRHERGHGRTRSGATSTGSFDSLNSSANLNLRRRFE